MPARRRLAFAGGLLLVALLPLAGRLVRGARGDRCSWDGVAIEARYRARLAAADGAPEAFCCLCCLRARVATLAGEPGSVVVADEATGAEMDASAAWYVDSAVVTNRSTECRLHAFATEDAAKRHAEAFHGTVLGRGLDAILRLDDDERRTR